MKKNNILSFILILITELLCVFITRFYVLSTNSESTYSFGMNVIQILYFIPTLSTSLYIFFSKSKKQKKLIISTIILIIYSIILHFFSKNIAKLFTQTSGIINFIEYAGKIYFVFLPLLGLKFIKIKNSQKLYIKLLLRIFILSISCVIAKYFFGLKGVLYCVPINELLIFFI